MKRTIPMIALVINFILLLGLSCNPRVAGIPAVSALPLATRKMEAPVLTRPQDWNPPVFPGAVSDSQIGDDLTAVAKTPGAIDETACDCFGFPVHNAVFHAYHSEAKTQEVIDFYSKQMAAEGWQSMSGQSTNSAVFHQMWQQGNKGPLVAYLMVAEMEDSKTLIYLSIAERGSP